MWFEEFQDWLLEQNDFSNSEFHNTPMPSPSPPSSLNSIRLTVRRSGADVIKMAAMVTILDIRKKPF